MNVAQKYVSHKHWSQVKMDEEWQGLARTTTWDEYGAIRASVANVGGGC